MNVRPLAAFAALPERDAQLHVLHGGIDADAERAELQRVLASALFQRSPRHRQFLQYVVERTQLGEFDALKEITLGVVVFGRRASTFDPQLDPIVRVEAARLRAKLARYYAGDGAHSRLHITIPKGRYRPRFVEQRGEHDYVSAHGSGLRTAAITIAQSAANTPGETLRKYRLLTHDEQARDYYQRGRYAAQQRDAAAYVTAIDLFRKAVAIDHGFAEAHAGLAMVLLDFAGFVLSPSDTLSTEARIAAQRAIALDPTSADAHVALAVCAHRVERNWPAAEGLFRQAVALAPASADSHSAFGFALTTRGRFVEAAEHLRLSRDLDPLNIGLRTATGQTASYWRRYAQAETELKAVLEVAPQHAYAEFALGLNALYSRKPLRAQEAFRRAESIFPGHASPHLCMAAALALDDRQRDARNQLATVLWRFANQYYCRYHLAIVCAYLGDRDGVYAALEQAAQTCDFLLVNLPVEPAFDAYHEEARFRAFLARNGLASLEDIAVLATPRGC